MEVHVHSGQHLTDHQPVLPYYIDKMWQHNTLNRRVTLSNLRLGTAHTDRSFRYILRSVEASNSTVS